MYTRTAFQLARDYAGKTVLWDTGDLLEVACRVEDARVMYGRELLLIAPVAGEGQKWVRANKCRAIPGEDKTNEVDANEPGNADRGSHAPAVAPTPPPRGGKRNR
jgi:hypothetical protein